MNMYNILIIALVNIFLRGHANIRRLLHTRTVQIMASDPNKRSAHTTCTGKTDNHRQINHFGCKL